MPSEPYLPGYMRLGDDDGCYVCDNNLGALYWPKGWPSAEAVAKGPRFFYCWSCDTLFCLEAGATSLSTEGGRT